MYSVVTPNRNRLAHLQQAVPSWQRCNEISEIVVVDYGSSPEITYSDFEQNAKLRIVTVRNTDQWRQGHATNLGVDFASSTQIAKLDSDQIVEDGTWLLTLDLQGSFYRGDFRPSTIRNGDVVFNKAHWARLGGYNEWLTGWGFDDIDFYARLRDLGIQQRYIESRFASEIPHGDDVRGTYDALYLYSVDRRNYKGRISFDNYKNMMIALSRPWRGTDRLEYSVVHLSDHRIEVNLPDWPEDFLRLNKVGQAISTLRHLSETNTRQVRTLLDEVFVGLIERLGGY